MKAARTYVSLTGRSLLGNTLTWMQELVMEFGDDAVSESLEEHALDVPADKLLGRVRDVLARRRLVEARSTPHELTRAELLGWIRGTFRPSLPAIYDLPRLGLSPDEVLGVEAWAARRLGMAPRHMPEPSRTPADAGGAA